MSTCHFLWQGSPIVYFTMFLPHHVHAFELQIHHQSQHIVSPFLIKPMQKRKKRWRTFNTWHFMQTMNSSSSASNKFASRSSMLSQTTTLATSSCISCILLMTKCNASPSNQCLRLWFKTTLITISDNIFTIVSQLAQVLENGTQP